MDVSIDKISDTAYVLHIDNDEIQIMGDVDTRYPEKNYIVLATTISPTTKIAIEGFDIIETKGKSDPIPIIKKSIQIIEDSVEDYYPFKHFIIKSLFAIYNKHRLNNVFI